MVKCLVVCYIVFVLPRGMEMKISYRKLWILLAEQEMTKQEFREELQIASGTMTKLNKGQEVSMAVILRICEYFNCNIGDVCDAVRLN